MYGIFRWNQLVWGYIATKITWNNGYFSPKWIGYKYFVKHSCWWCHKFIGTLQWSSNFGVEVCAVWNNNNFQGSHLYIESWPLQVPAGSKCVISVASNFLPGRGGFHCWLKCINSPQEGLLQVIEAETKWPPFRRLQFHLQFLEWKCYNLDMNFTEVCS